MAFVKELRKIRDEFPEWQYLTDIGVRDLFGKEINTGTTGLVVDRENNYYLIPQGCTNRNRDGEDAIYYVLCVGRILVPLKAIQQSKGFILDNNYECHWEVIIKAPENLYDYINKNTHVQIIKDAFVAETYTKVFTPEKVKKITVNVNC